MTDFDEIRYRVSDGIAILAIDRPDAHNAFTRHTILEMTEALDQAAADDGVYALVLTGRDGKFCAGADLDDMPSWPDRGRAEYAAFLRTVQGIVRRLYELPLPTIAAVEGAAVGAGCDFALACDMRVLHPEALLREGFVLVGLVPGDGGAWLLTRHLGRARAMEYLLTGVDIDASEATDLGLANRVTETPRETAMALAAEVRRLPRRAVARTKQLANVHDFEASLSQAVEYQLECIHDPEHREAVSAMQAGRDPEFDREYTDDGEGKL